MTTHERFITSVVRALDENTQRLEQAESIDEALTCAAMLRGFIDCVHCYMNAVADTENRDECERVRWLLDGQMYEMCQLLADKLAELGAPEEIVHIIEKERDHYRE